MDAPPQPPQPPQPPPPALRAARAERTTTARWSAPTAPLRIVKRFKLVAPYAAGGHRGIDLATTAGAVVRSPCSGAVSFSGTVAGSPPIVTVRCGALRATLRRVAPNVEFGDQVPAGGAVGHATSTRIDLSARSASGHYLDPAQLLPARPAGGPGPVAVPRGAVRRPAQVRRGPPAKVSEVVSPATGSASPVRASTDLPLGLAGSVIGGAGVLLSGALAARRRVRRRSNLTEGRATIA